MLINLAYTDCRLDRAAHRRADPAWIDARMGDASSRFVPVFRDRNLVVDRDGLRAAVLTAAEAGSLLLPPVVSAFLGIDGDGSAWFAIEADDTAAADLRGRGAGRFVDLRRVSAGLPANDGAVLAYARGLMHWHRHQRFCGRCGSPTASGQGGYARVCSHPDCKTQHFPRTDPAIIVLVTRQEPGDEACLLARQSHFPDGLMTTLAGFVEPGENVEEAVVREMYEEIGVRVGRIRYRGSQPWPFPASLMLAFRGEVEDGQIIRLDNSELETARWFTRADLEDIRTLGLKLPPRDSVARRLIEDWWQGREE